MWIAPVLLPARLIVIRTHRALFSIADDGELGRRDSHPDQVIPGSLGAPVAKTEIVLVGAALIAVAFDGQLVIRVVLEDVAKFRRIRLQRRDGVGPEVVAVVIEIRIRNAGQQFVDVGAGCRIGIPGRSGCRAGWVRATAGAAAGAGAGAGAAAGATTGGGVVTATFFVQATVNTNNAPAMARANTRSCFMGFLSVLHCTPFLRKDILSGGDFTPSGFH